MKFGIAKMCGLTVLIIAAFGPHWAAASSESGSEREQMSRMLLEKFMEHNRGHLLTDARAVVDRCLEVTGGRKTWQDIHTMQVTVRVCDAGGEDTTLVRSYKRPGKYRQEVRGSGTAMVCDGIRVWRVSDGDWVRIDAPGILRLASPDDHLLHPTGSGTRLSFVGLEVLGANPVYRVDRVYGDGYQEALYFSATSGLLTCKRTPHPVHGQSFMSFWDFRKRGGVWIPSAFIRSSGGDGPPHGGVIQNVEVNIPLEDSLFHPPEVEDAIGGGDHAR